MNILYPPPPKPLDLNDAPTEIQVIKQDLKGKLEGGTFAWNDIGEFITLAQYISDNSPAIAELITGWERTIVFDITDEDYLWFITENNVITIGTGSTPPAEIDITITLSFATFSSILARDQTAISSFQNGNLDFTGALNDAIKVDRIAQIYAATIMDVDIDVVSSSINLVVTENHPNLYQEGLTLMPCTEMILDNGSSTFGIGHVIVYDQNGIH